MHEFTSGIFTVNPVVGKVQRAFNLPAHLRHLQPLIVVLAVMLFCFGCRMQCPSYISLLA